MALSNQPEAARLIVIPRWGGSPTSDWYPWLQRALEAREEPAFAHIVLADMPEPDLPTVPAWVEKVEELLGPDPDELSRTVLVGHSVGCQAVLRSLERLPTGQRVRAVVCVAGWFDVDESWPDVVPWTGTPIDFDRVRSAAEGFAVIVSDNDPFTSDWVENGRLWGERLGATVEMVPGVHHFNGPRYPAILDAILHQLGIVHSG